MRYFLRFILLTMIATGAAHADYPSGSVRTAPVALGQSYPGVNANSEGWFDVGGFCKVVDVGDLSSVAPGAHGVPVFIPGPPEQWENYRTAAVSRYNGQLTLTTCCRPQTNIANLCTEAGATLVSVDRQYGKVGEVDTVTATCVDMWGVTYTDSMNVVCEVSGGASDGPDAQAVWAETTADATSNCLPNAHITFGDCSASCGGGATFETIQDSCGVVTAQGFIGPPCNTQNCTPPPPPTPPTIFGVWNVISVVLGECGPEGNSGAGGIPAGSDINGQSCTPIGDQKSIDYTQSGSDPGCQPLAASYHAVTNHYQCQATRGFTWTPAAGGRSIGCLTADVSTPILQGTECPTPGKEVTQVNSEKFGGPCSGSAPYETAIVWLVCE